MHRAKLDLLRNHQQEHQENEKAEGIKMAIVVASHTTLSLTTGSKSADQVTGRNQYVGKGRIQFAARASAVAATGIRATLSVGGVALVDDQLLPFGGATGGLSVRDNMILDQVVAGGRVELTYRNDSAGTLTVDGLVLFTPM